MQGFLDKFNWCQVIDILRKWKKTHEKLCDYYLMDYSEP